MNTLRFETFSPIRRRTPSASAVSPRRQVEQQRERRKAERLEKARRCGRVFA